MSGCGFGAAIHAGALRTRTYVTLAEIAARLPMLRVVRDRFGREGRYRTDRLVDDT